MDPNSQPGSTATGSQRSRPHSGFDGAEERTYRWGATYTTASSTSTCSAPNPPTWSSKPAKRERLLTDIAGVIDASRRQRSS